LTGFSIRGFIGSLVNELNLIIQQKEKKREIFARGGIPRVFLLKTLPGA